MRRERQLDASHSTHWVVLLDERDQLLTARDCQPLTRESRPLQVLEEPVHVDLLEQEATTVQNVLAFTYHVILDRKELVGQGATMAIPCRENRELALTIHGQKLLELRHLSSSLVAYREGRTVAVFFWESNKTVMYSPYVTNFLAASLISSRFSSG